MRGYVTEEEGQKGDQLGSWTEYYADLEGDRRAATLVTEGGKRLWMSLSGAAGDDELPLSTYARVDLARYGVVFRRLTEREIRPPRWKSR